MKEIVPKRLFKKKDNETHIKILPLVSPDQPLNNWAQEAKKNVLRTMMWVTAMIIAKLFFLIDKGVSF